MLGHDLRDDLVSELGFGFFVIGVDLSEDISHEIVCRQKTHLTKACCFGTAEASRSSRTEASVRDDWMIEILTHYVICGNLTWSEVR
jgi:hypothetical protein